MLIVVRTQTHARDKGLLSYSGNAVNIRVPPSPTHTPSKSQRLSSFKVGTILFCISQDQGYFTNRCLRGTPTVISSQLCRLNSFFVTKPRSYTYMPLLFVFFFLFFLLCFVFKKLNVDKSVYNLFHNAGYSANSYHSML